MDEAPLALTLHICSLLLSFQRSGGQGRILPRPQLCKILLHSHFVLPRPQSATPGSVLKVCNENHEPGKTVSQAALFPAWGHHA